MGYLTTLEERLRLFWCLRNGTKKCYLELSLGWGCYENPREKKSVGFVSGARLCHKHNVTATKINFPLRKNDDPIKPEIYLCCQAQAMHTATQVSVGQNARRSPERVWTLAKKKLIVTSGDRNPVARCV
jgi:hypothetical protein